MTISRPIRLTIAVVYFLTTCVLFFLPGSAFPKEDWLDKIYFDKWVHIGLFAVLTLLWCWALQIKTTRGLVTLLVVWVLYGITVEVIQGLFIENRSFDLLDWASDSFGALLALWFWRRRYIKR